MFQGIFGNSLYRVAMAQENRTCTHLFPLDPKQAPTHLGTRILNREKTGHSKQRCRMGMSRTSDSRQQPEQAPPPSS